MIVEELFATLGLKVDTEKFLEAEGMVGKLKIALGALAVTLGVRELKEMVHGVAEMADAANKSSLKLGITAESVQELGYAAKLADVSQGTLEASLFRLSRGLEQVTKKGTGPAADALRKLHVNIKDLKGEGLDANLEVLADAFQKMPDGAAKIAAARQLLGGAGIKLLPLFSEGAEGIRKAREEAQKLGIVVSDELAKKFEEFNDDQTRVSEAWRGIRVQIVSALLPALHELVTGMLEWIKSHEPLIQGLLSAALETVTVAFKVLGFVIGEVTDFLQAAFAHPEAIILFSGIITGAFIPAIVEATAAMVPLALAWLALNWPILAIAAAIAAVVLIVNHWAEIWPVVTRAAEDAWKRVMDGIQSFIDWVSDLLPRLMTDIAEQFDKLGEVIDRSMDKAFDYLVERAKQTASDVWQALKDIPGLGPAFVIANKLMSSDDAAGGSGAPGSQDSVSAVEGQMVANFGDTSVTIQTTGTFDEETVGRLAAEKVKEAQQNMLGDAYESLRGGKR